MYSILAHVTIQPQQVDEYLSLIREHARDSLRDEAGTLGFEVIQDEKDPTHFYVHETYADEAAFHTHMHGEIAVRNFPKMAALAAGKLDDSVFIGKGINLVVAET
jgi:autoinducer 2-degrading protein